MEGINTKNAGINLKNAGGLKMKINILMTAIWLKQN